MRTVTAAGATQATATAIAAQYNVVTTATQNQGVILPSGFSPGDDLDVVNKTTTNICVYPPVGSNLNGNTTNAPCIMAPNTMKTFINMDGTNWACDSI